jgi:hypothetical protein
MRTGIAPKRRPLEETRIDERPTGPTSRAVVGLGPRSPAGQDLARTVVVWRRGTAAIPAGGGDCRGFQPTAVTAAVPADAGEPGVAEWTGIDRIVVRVHDIGPGPADPLTGLVRAPRAVPLAAVSDCGSSTTSPTSTSPSSPPPTDSPFGGAAGVSQRRGRAAPEQERRASERGRSIREPRPGPAMGGATAVPFTQTGSRTGSVSPHAHNVSAANSSATAAAFVFRGIAAMPQQPARFGRNRAAPRGQESRGGDT